MEQQTLPGIPAAPALTNWNSAEDPPMIGWYDFTEIFPPNEENIRRRWWGGPIMGWTVPYLGNDDVKPPYLQALLRGWWRGLVEPADHYPFPLQVKTEFQPMKPLTRGQQIYQERIHARKSIPRVPINKPVERVRVLKG